MISHISGKLLARGVDRIEVLTASGIGYELHIPLSVFEQLPPAGEVVSLPTHLSVKEDGWQLFGFGSVFEREVFRRILLAKGVGPGLALGILSALRAERVVRAIREKDVALLVTIPRIGRKKAEQIVLDLADKMDELLGEPEDTPDGGASAAGGGGAAAEAAVKALALLGYTSAESERAVRVALESGAKGKPTAAIIREALAVASGGARR
jgi:Holliday junction DNA helicase RuvA